MAAAGAAVLLPAILGGFKGQAQQAPGGLGSLLDMNGDGNPLDDIIGMAGLKLSAI